MVREPDTRQTSLRGVALLVLAGIIVVGLCFLGYEAFHLSRNVSLLQKTVNNDIHDIQKKLDGLEKKVIAIGTSVGNFQEQNTTLITLINDLKSYLEQTPTPEEWQKFREQINKGIREEVRTELRALRESKQTGD